VLLTSLLGLNARYTAPVATVEPAQIAVFMKNRRFRNVSSGVISLDGILEIGFMTS
jgi:hypothetical protein